MPTEISQRCRAISPSATLTVDARAKAMRAEGIDVIGFGAGEPDFPTPDYIKDFDTPQVGLDAFKEALDRGQTRYTPVAGTLELRTAIASRMFNDHGLQYSTDEIIVCNGAKHALYNAFQAILNPGDEVIVDKPCWVSYPEMVRMAEGRPVFLNCPESQGFLPKMDDLVRCISPRTKAFVLNTPSNPNGCVWTREQLRELADLAVEHDFYIIADEIYEKLVYGDAKHYSIASFSPAVKRRTILINGVSKAYAMTGLRIGYACGPKEVIQAMVKYQSHATSSANAAAQHAAAVALTMDQTCVEEMRKVYEQRRNKLVELINDIPGLSCRMPSGAFYVMMNIRGIQGKTFDGRVLDSSATIAEMMLEHAHVAVVPGVAFMAEGYCRMSYATSMENIVEGMKRIAAFVRELK